MFLYEELQSLELEDRILGGEGGRAKEDIALSNLLLCVGAYPGDAVFSGVRDTLCFFAQGA